MSTKTACLTLVLSLMSGIILKRYHPQMAKSNNAYHALSSKTIAPEIFKVSRDTVHVNIEGRLSRALLIRDKYYAFYEIRDPMSTLPIRKFYIIKKSGKIEEEIKVPEGILNDTHPKLYYWGSRIIVNTEFYKSTYYLDPEKGEFVKYPEYTKVPLFEDENYQVTSDCKGEWGSTIYFKNKTTRITYSAFSGCPLLVNKLGDKYLVNTSDMVYDDIIEINDPTTSTTRTVFRRNNLDSHFYIPTSFITNGILYHIYNSSQDEFRLDGKKERVIIIKDSVKIGIIHDGKFKPVYTFKDKFDLVLEQHLSPEYQICTFHTEERIQIGFKKDIPPYMEAKYGVIEITGDEIKIHYFISKKVG